MINWPIIPMVYNDSFTYMEWLGKLTYIADNHETRINDCEKNIVDLWAEVNNHEGRITGLEDWRRDTVDPFIVKTNFRLGELETWRTKTVDPFIASTTDTLADHENRITDAENDIDSLEGRMDGTEADIDALENWRDNTFNPFVTDIGGRMTTAETKITNLRTDLTAESSVRRNADETLFQRVGSIEIIAKDAYNTAQRIKIVEKNVGTVRYFMGTATVTSNGYGGTSLSFVLPDEDWVTCDVRFLAGGSEYRVTGNITDTTLLPTADNGKYFGFTYDSSTRTVTVNVDSTVWTATDIKRFDYILYNGALTQAAQDQADIDYFNAMDVDGNGIINACEAAWTLDYYIDASNSVIPSNLHGKEAWTWWVNNVHPDSPLNPDSFPDFNGNGVVDAIDASLLLSYYAWISTTDTSGLTGPQCLKLFRTKSLGN